MRTLIALAIVLLGAMGLGIITALIGLQPQICELVGIMWGGIVAFCSVKWVLKDYF